MMLEVMEIQNISGMWTQQTARSDDFVWHEISLVTRRWLLEVVIDGDFDTLWST
jgi:hypothetical protein